jgi:hypothetical protein
LAKKTIGEDEYNNWNREFEKAMLTTQGREEAVANTNEKIESNL